MTLEARPVPLSYPRKRYFPGTVLVPDTAVERKTTLIPRRPGPVPKQLDAGPFEAEVDSFRLHLAAEGKAGRTLDTYTEAVRWFAAGHLLRQTDKSSWEQVERQDLQRWTVWLLGEYSTAYASNQFRAVRRFLRWLAAEQDRPDPTAGLRAPTASPRLVPVFTSEELSALRAACHGRSFAARRDAAIIEVLLATGIRRSEVAGIRCDPDRGDLDLAGREIRVRGKGGRERIVKISYQAARSVDRYLRARARHPLAARPELWLGVGGRGPVTPDGSTRSWPRPARRPVWRCTRTGSGITSPTPG
jgi:integrase/recombinase XerD